MATDRNGRLRRYLLDRALPVRLPHGETVHVQLNIITEGTVRADACLIHMDAQTAANYRRAVAEHPELAPARGRDTSFASGGLVARGGGEPGFRDDRILPCYTDDTEDACRYTMDRVAAALAQAAQDGAQPYITWDERGVFTIEGDEREFLAHVMTDGAYAELWDVLAGDDDAALARAVVGTPLGDLEAALADVREARDQHAARLLAQATGAGYEDRSGPFTRAEPTGWEDRPGTEWVPATPARLIPESATRYHHPLVIARMEAAARSGMSVFGHPDMAEVAAAERCPLPLRKLADSHRLQLAGGPGADYWAWRHVATGVWIGEPEERHNGLDPATDLTAPVPATAAEVRRLLADLGLDEQDSP